MYSLYFYLRLLYFLIYFIIKSYLFHTFSNMLLVLYCVFSNNFIKSQSLTRIYPILGELRRLFGNIISFWSCMDGLVIVLLSSLKWRSFFFFPTHGGCEIYGDLWRVLISIVKKNYGRLEKAIQCHTINAGDFM